MRDGVVLGRKGDKWEMLVDPGVDIRDAIAVYRKARGNDCQIGNDEFDEVRFYDGPVFHRARKRIVTESPEPEKEPETEDGSLKTEDPEGDEKNSEPEKKAGDKRPEKKGAKSK